MLKIIIIAVMALGVTVATAASQDSADQALAGLPKGCRDAIPAMPMGGPMKEMMQGKGMAGMPGMMGMMDDAQKASMQAMMKMHRPMMAAHMIKDPDLAFNCGMMVHHQGAIEMAKIELEFGKDQTTRQLAQAIISAQEKEIADMARWVDAYKPK
jgi:uncharacterized protein (DUF305 family)